MKFNRNIKMNFRFKRAAVKAIASLCIILISFSLSFAQFEKTGNIGAQFLKIGVGARAAGMATSFVAVSNDITALYWNPAGIVWLENNAAIVSHNKWIADTNYEFIAYAHSFNQQNAIGFFMSYLSFGEIEQTTIRNPSGTGVKFFSYDLAVGGSYSRRLIEDFAIGVTGKYIREQIWDMASTTFAFDIGALFSPGFKPLHFGVSLSNFGKDAQFNGVNLDQNLDLFPDQDPIDVRFQTTPYPIPLIFRFGFAYDFFTGEEKLVTLSVEGRHLTDTEQKVNFGLEYHIFEGIALRTGFRANDDEGYYAAGFGINKSIGNAVNAQIDYAFQDVGRLLNSHRLSLIFEF